MKWGGGVCVLVCVLGLWGKCGGGRFLLVMILGDIMSLGIRDKTFRNPHIRSYRLLTCKG